MPISRLTIAISFMLTMVSFNSARAGHLIVSNERDDTVSVLDLNSLAIVACQRGNARAVWS